MKKGTLSVISTILGAAVGAAGTSYLKEKKIACKSDKVDKFKAYYNMLNEWLILKQQGKNLSEYFKVKNLDKIAIYGMGEMGKRLFDELKDTEIEVKYAIDKNAAGSYSGIEILELDDDLETVDAIVVSAIFAFDEIEEELSAVVAYPIISLSDVVYEI